MPEDEALKESLKMYTVVYSLVDGTIRRAREEIASMIGTIVHHLNSRVKDKLEKIAEEEGVVMVLGVDMGNGDLRTIRPALQIVSMEGYRQLSGEEARSLVEKVKNSLGLDASYSGLKIEVVETPTVKPCSCYGKNAELLMKTFTERYFWRGREGE